MDGCILRCQQDGIKCEGVFTGWMDEWMDDQNPVDIH